MSGRGVGTILAPAPRPRSGLGLNELLGATTTILMLGEKRAANEGKNEAGKCAVVAQESLALGDVRDLAVVVELNNLTRLSNRL